MMSECHVALRSTTPLCVNATSTQMSTNGSSIRTKLTESLKLIRTGSHNLRYPLLVLSSSCLLVCLYACTIFQVQFILFGTVHKKIYRR